MKKIITLLLVLIMSLSLVSCGGPDKQPAIDKFNETSKAFNAVSARINDNIELFDESNIETMTEWALLLNEYSQLLSSSEEIPQEDLDAMIEWFDEVNTWVAEVDAELDSVL